VLVVAVCVSALVACGRSGYQYLESEDERVFAKIPDDWDVVSQGIIDFVLRPSDGSQVRLLPGDDTLPWRARFTADPSGRVGPDHVSGYVDVQPVDARMRDQVTLDVLAEIGTTDGAIGEPRPIVLGDLEGFRLRLESAGDDPLVNDRLVLTDDRRTVVYVIQAGCRQPCFDDNAAVIDEIMRTFTVKP
jgi:hypothetical protein